MISSMDICCQMFTNQSKDAFASNCVLIKERIVSEDSFFAFSFLSDFLQCNSASQNSYLRVLLRHHDDVLLYKSLCASL